MAVRLVLILLKTAEAARAVVLTKSDVAGPGAGTRDFFYHCSSWLCGKDLLQRLLKLEGEKTDALANLPQTAQKLGAAWN